MRTGYPEDFLSSRARLHKDIFAIIPPEGLVNNVVPGFENCIISILSTPKMGASFVDYILTLQKGGRNIKGFGGDGVEAFMYCISGSMKVSIDDKEYEIKSGGYIYCPPSKLLKFENTSDGDTRAFLYKRRYEPLEGYNAPDVYIGDVTKMEYKPYADMPTVLIKDLLPTSLDFDFNFHILAFKPGSSHPFIETHYQEHGAYVLSGAGIYYLDNEWIPIKKDDYMFMASYVTQATYAVGHTDEMFAYVYSKDCNRDIEI